MSLKALWRLQQPLKRTHVYGFTLRTLNGLQSVTSTKLNYSTLTLHHHTYNCSISRLQKLLRPHTSHCHVLNPLNLISKTWSTQMRLQSTTTPTKSILIQGGMPGKRTLKGPRTKQPSRTNQPRQEEEVCVCVMSTCIFNLNDTKMNI